MRKDDAWPHAQDPLGELQASGDGPELLVWDADGQPRWKAFCDDLLVDVGIAEGGVLTVDRTGRLVGWSRADGGREHEVDLGGRPVAMAVHRSGRVVVALADAVVAVESGRVVWRLPLAEATAIALDADGVTLAAGSRGGTLVIARPGAADASHMGLGAPVEAIASAGGGWLVAVGGAVVAVGPVAATKDAPPSWSVQATSWRPGGPVRSLRVDLEGIVAAALVGEGEVHVADRAGTADFGVITLKRHVGGLAFGPGLQLGIGLDDGDACRYELPSGRTGRTEPHPGRARSTWGLQSGVDHARIRGIVAHARAGGKPLAMLAQGPDADGGRRWWLIGGGCLLLSLGCGGLLGAGGLGHYYFGWF